MRNLFVMIAAICLLGCFESRKTAGEYVSWVENPENGLRRSKELNGFSVIAQFRPVDYIICSESKNSALTNAHYEKRKGELSGLEYYQVRLQASDSDPLMWGTSDQNMYHLRNNYLMFDQQTNISLLRNNDTIPCALYHFVNYQGLAPYADILIGFVSDSAFTGDRELIYDDQLFGIGPIHYTFTEDEINAVPELELN